MCENKCLKSYTFMQICDNVKTKLISSYKYIVTYRVYSNIRKAN